MGIFQSTDKLDELKKRFLEPDKQLYEILIYEVVENFSNLISPRYKDKQKTTRIENASKIMYNTITEIIDYIELDEADLDDIMSLQNQCDLRIEMINNPNQTTSQWLDLWDKTQDNLSKLANILSQSYITFQHQKYYKTMLTVKKTLRTMYKRRELYSTPKIIK